MRFILFSALFLGCVTFLSSQNKKDTLSFIVSGNCGMCEKIIESVQYEKGVVVSDWKVLFFFRITTGQTLRNDVGKVLLCVARGAEEG